jgi:hypothetical protein
MTTRKAKTIADAADKIAKEHGNIEPEVVRQAIIDAIRTGNLDKGYNFLSFNGVLPVHLPDGTRVAVLPDIHVPAHNKKILWSVIQALKDYKPHILILIGDVADVFGLSAWPVPPGVVRNLNSELEQTRRLVDRLVAESGCHWCFYIMGNHEDRIWRYLCNVAPHLANVTDPNTREPIVSVHGLLGYKPGDNVTFIYDTAERGGFGGAIVINDDTEFHHGFIVRPNPGASPRADSERTGRSTGTGHTHRAGFSVRETNDGAIMSMEFGHLVDVKHAYMAYANTLNNWHPAIGFGTILGGKTHMEVLPIRQIKMSDGQLRHVFTFNGKVYVSSDR